MNVKPRILLPHVAGLFVGGFCPSVPDVTLQPVAGETSQLIFVDELVDPFEAMKQPLIVLLLKLICVLMHPTLGAVTKVCGGLEM